MVPRWPTTRCRNLPAPRARGDGPWHPGCRCSVEPCSPRTRGWSLRRDRRQPRRRLLPAHAGMVPSGPTTRTLASPAPRARGDGPWTDEGNSVVAACSPRTRGWSRHGRTRLHGHALLPAHAGMVPRSALSCHVFSSAPRARGDGPPTGRPFTRGGHCSPRTRGWSPVHDRLHLRLDLLPGACGDDLAGPTGVLGTGSFMADGVSSADRRTRDVRRRGPGYPPLPKARWTS